MKPLRPAGDVSALPTVTFGRRSLMWWGTVGFMVIEGWTLALSVAGYLYLRQNFTTWPPLRTQYPSLLIPTINLAVMGLSCVPASLAARAAHALDEGGVKIWLSVSGAIGIPILVLRWYELWALNVRWDTNAYGSAAWVTVGLHASLLLLDVGDTIGLSVMYWLKDMPVKTMSDVADNSLYWYFMVLAWVPLYAIIYLGPRFF